VIVLRISLNIGKKYMITYVFSIKKCKNFFNEKRERKRDFNSFIKIFEILVKLFLG